MRAKLTPLAGESNGSSTTVGVVTRHAADQDESSELKSTAAGADIAIVRMRTGIVIALVLGALLSGCGSAPNAFLGRASNAAVFVQWTRNGDQLVGSIHQSLIKSGDQQSVDNETVPFTGTVSGQSVTLTLNGGLGITSNVTGTLNGSQLHLDYPGSDGGIATLDMHPASSGDYEQAVSALQADVDRANTAKQQAQQQQQQAQQVQADSSRVQTDLSNLSSAIQSAGNDNSSSYSSDLQQARDDVSQTHTDMQKALDEQGHTDSGSLCSDAGSVQSDVGSVESDVGSIQSDQGSTSSDTSAISEAMNQLRQDDAALQADRQNEPGDLANDAPTEDQVRSAIHAAHAAAGSATGTGGSAYAQAQRLLAQARSYQRQSDAACNATGA